MRMRISYISNQDWKNHQNYINRFCIILRENSRPTITLGIYKHTYLKKKN